MSYKNIEEFSKMVKNSKSLRHKELRLQTDQAVLILSEITEILAQKFYLNLLEEYLLIILHNL